MQETVVLSTSRAIRARLLESRKSNTFLPNYLTMSEFLSRLILVDKKVLFDKDQRTLLLLEASKFSDFNKLKIDRNFFSFLKNSEYIFKFFEELSGELVDINSLVYADTYGDYEEHITILIELYHRYQKVCTQKSCIDPIFVKQEYALHEGYIKSLANIHIEVEGYITNFEFQLLQQCSKYTTLNIHYFASPFNAKLQSRFSQGVTSYGRVNYSLNSMEIIETQSDTNSINAIAHEFSERINQVAFVKQKVYSYINEGIEPENIVVVLPDESFAEYLYLYDDKHNFNFAMGVSLKHAHSLKVLQACCDYLDNSSVQNQQRLSRYEFYGIELLQEHYYDVVSQEQFEQLINHFLTLETNRAMKKVIEEELFSFVKIIPELESLSFKSLSHLFLKRCLMQSVDDVRGGKITVMGVLETRGIHFDGVIVVDFNEDVVPHKSEKDLFFNSATRKHAKLPTSEDRENLQKHYYYMLFSHAKHVDISYVLSDVAKPSRFLMQLQISSSKGVDDEYYTNILYNTDQNRRFIEEDETVSFDFTKHQFSASSLKAYLQCKRKFYYRYVKKLHSHDIPSDMPQEHAIGSTLHEALKVLYSNKESYNSIDILQKDFNKALYSVSGSSELEKFQLKLWQKKMYPFFENEMKRFSDGVSVVGCEQSITTHYKGMKLKGTIDRVDSVNNSYLQVIDYKSGSFPTYTTKSVDKAVDFQLEFYKILVESEYEKPLDALGGCFYYDLKTGMLEAESVLDLKLDKLNEHLAILQATKSFINERCEDRSVCTFCEYTYLCDRA